MASGFPHPIDSSAAPGGCLVEGVGVIAAGSPHSVVAEAVAAALCGSCVVVADLAAYLVFVHDVSSSARFPMNV